MITPFLIRDHVMIQNKHAERLVLFFPGATHAETILIVGKITVRGLLVLVSQLQHPQWLILHCHIVECCRRDALFTPFELWNLLEVVITFLFVV